METTLTIHTDKDRISEFVILLRFGFQVKTQVGCSVKDFLCGQLGILPDYYKTRIQTLFLNSKPVDDPETAKVPNGATLALSAAMPGLVGATLRRGGHYSPMRGSITHTDDNQTSKISTGWVTLKLFNLILKELGPHFLNQGVWLDSKSIGAFFQEKSDSLNVDISRVVWNGEEISPNGLLAIALPEGRVFLRIS